MLNKRTIFNHLDIAALILPIVCVGVYISFFYFGSNIYFYFTFSYVNILLTSLSLFALICILNLTFFFIIIKVNTKLIYYYKGLLFSTIVYFTFHFIVRFSDVYYKDIYEYLFDTRNFFLKVLFFSFPFFFGIFIYFFTKLKISRIYEFLFILILILFTLSIVRFKDIYYFEKNNNTNFLKSDYGNLKKISTIKNFNRKKVFLILFDEFDNGYFQKNLNYFPYLKGLISKSFIHQQFYTPGMYTMDSIPAILLGSSTKKTMTKNGNLTITNNDNQKIDFNKKNSIFGDVEERNLMSSIYGYYHPYCRIFNINTCFDKLDFKKEKISFLKSIEIFLHISYISRIYKSNPLISHNHEKETLEYIELSKVMYQNSNDFINNDTDFIYIHYQFPHLPDISSEFIDLSDLKEDLSASEKNYFIVEQTMKKIIPDLMRYQGSLLIVTTDHWFKERGGGQKAYPAVFISKIIGDDSSLISNRPTNASAIRKLIKNFFDQEILNNKDIKSHFDSSPNHKILIR
tara:strand:+ start:5811 stop:7355 length:1545 start_codon:yes stop_codon:yes gene_type:complete